MLNNDNNDENYLQIIHTSPCLLCPNPEPLCVRSYSVTKMDKDSCFLSSSRTNN